MEESRELRQLFTFMQGAVYGSIALEVLMYVHLPELPELILAMLNKLQDLPIYRHMWLSKAFTMGLIIIVAIGSRPKKSVQLHLVKQIVVPLFTGLIMLIISVYFYHQEGPPFLYSFSLFHLFYILCALIGAVSVHVALDNVSKHVKSGLMKDRFNIENESFEQQRKKIETPYSINVPMRYHYKQKLNRGWLNILNPFRGTLLIGTPGSGKTYSIIIPAIEQHLAKGFTMVVYDFKFPDLAAITYRHYLGLRKHGKLKKHRFHIINLNHIAGSRRVNPLKACYITSMAAATETAEALIEALRKSDRSHGADQFFSQSAINFLAAIIYFLSRYQAGKFSTLAHVMALTNHSYEEIFDTLHQMPELQSLLAPFKSAYEKKAFDQLEGQVGTLRINLSRLATKETYWVFSGDDVELSVNDPENPAVLVIANDPATQQINSACYAVILNRLTRQLNRKHQLPCSLIIDEVPTVYIHRVENLLATARSNRISILLGLQELTQFRQQYGREVAETICSVTGNVLSGAVRHRDTLNWLEKMFGKVRQVRNGISVDRYRTSISMNEYLDFLIPASRIANLRTGELVGHVAGELEYATNTYHCQVVIDERGRNRALKKDVDLPIYYDFENKQAEALEANMQRIVGEVKGIVAECGA